MALGLDNEASRRRAAALYAQWTAIRENAELRAKAEARGRQVSREDLCATRRYPPGSIGAAWQEWIRSKEWARMAPSTRNKIWWETWNKRIEPIFGDLQPEQVTMAMLSDWREEIERTSGQDPAHKAFKVWRAFWKKMVAMRYASLSDPSLGIKNVAPPSRQQKFSYGEAMRLAKEAWRRGYRGLACIIVIAWDSGFSPVDCRTLCAKHVGVDLRTERYIFDRSAEGRRKTGVPVIGTLSPFGDWLVRRYLEQLGAALTPEAILFRMRTNVPYGQSRLGGDFAAIREAVFPGDKRQLRDMRRSGVMEAYAGGAVPAHIAQKFGNSIDRSGFLFRTYNPVDLEQVRAADEKRIEGRRKRNKS
jgi:hypothetical protein